MAIIVATVLATINHLTI
ncbi:hypothetical protein A2U01_0078617, partial [Trifolium medium]|nr:hypothetical protein [Trifolium medium]